MPKMKNHENESEDEKRDDKEFSKNKIIENGDDDRYTRLCFGERQEYVFNFPFALYNVTGEFAESQQAIKVDSTFNFKVLPFLLHLI